MRVGVGRAVRTTAAIALAAFVMLPFAAFAQAPAEEPFYGSSLITPVPAGEKMLVEADQLVYDYDRNSVSAVGNVTI